MIYVNGDSWTAGWPLEEILGHRNDSWPHILENLSNQPVINDARSGCSNYRIYRKTFDYILTKKPKLAIVCLTSWVRFEMGDVDSGKIYQYMPSSTTATDIYQKYWHPYLEYTNFLRQIIALQQLASASQTNLYFLDTFNNNLIRSPTLEWFKDILRLGNIFDKWNDETINKKFQNLIMLNECINYNKFISEHSYQDLIKGCKLDQGHPVRDGHEKIAQIIYNLVKKDI